MRDDPDAWLTPSHAARLADCDPSTIRRWATDGRLRVKKTPGGHRRISRASLMDVCSPEGPEGAAAPLDGTDSLSQAPDGPHEAIAAVADVADQWVDLDLDVLTDRQLTTLTSNLVIVADTIQTLSALLTDERAHRKEAAEAAERKARRAKADEANKAMLGEDWDAA